MLNGNGTAYADGQALPVRFGTWFFGNGIIPDRWVPTHDRRGQRLGAQRAAGAAAGREALALTCSRASRSRSRTTRPTRACRAQRSPARRRAANSVQLPTVDQVVAKLIGVAGGPSCSRRVLHVGISNTSGATSLGPRDLVRGPNAPNAPNYSPARPVQEPLAVREHRAARPSRPIPSCSTASSCWTPCAEDAKSLRMRLGADDQKRLDLHLDGLSQLQQQIVAAADAEGDGHDHRSRQGLPEPRHRRLDHASARAGVLGSAGVCDGRAISRASSRTCSAARRATATTPTAASTRRPSTRTTAIALSPKGLTYATTGFNTGVKLRDVELRRHAGAHEGDARRRGQPARQLAASTRPRACPSPRPTAVRTTRCSSPARRAASSRAISTSASVDENVSKVPFTLLTAMGGKATSLRHGRSAGQQRNPRLAGLKRGAGAIEPGSRRRARRIGHRVGARRCGAVGAATERHRAAPPATARARPAAASTAGATRQRAATARRQRDERGVAPRRARRDRRQPSGATGTGAAGTTGSGRRRA